MLTFDKLTWNYVPRRFVWEAVVEVPNLEIYLNLARLAITTNEPRFRKNRDFNVIVIESVIKEHLDICG